MNRSSIQTLIPAGAPRHEETHMHSSTPLATLVLRVALGLLFLAHGLAKLLVYTLPGTAAFFESVGYPGILAYPVTLAEVAGGLLLVAGLATRWAALGLVPVALGATAVHWPNGWLFNNPGGGWEFTAFLAAASLALALLPGDGALSVGAALRRRREPAGGGDPGVAAGAGAHAA